jgi:glycosyltransferase involved in cell wall biosynthesis
MISIVIPAYNEERNLQALYAELREVLRAAGEDDFELVIVDDGSTDGTWETISAMSAADVRVRGVRLSRNFGHQSALMAGLAAGRGQAEPPPRLVEPLISERGLDLLLGGDPGGDKDFSELLLHRRVTASASPGTLRARRRPSG